MKRQELEILLNKLSPNTYSEFKIAKMNDYALILCVNAHLVCKDCLPYSEEEVNGLLKSMAED